MPLPDTARNDRAIGLWLLLCAAMIFVMALIGAITRLTDSGLSIMEWAPLKGALPPLSGAEWERLFALYRQIPEYRIDNAGMTLAEFKTIFWWEYIHRLWGRLIGLVFLLPFCWFLWRRRIAWDRKGAFIALFVLGGLQGALGWFMVASGFAERTDVSQYRLVAHLVMALVIYAAVLWVALDHLAPGRADPGPMARPLRRWLCWLLALVAVTIASGGFVAGLKAGLIYNTFPLMDGDLVPAGYGHLEPFARNLFENHAAVQFNHRLLALATLAAALAVWLRSRALMLPATARRALALMAGLALLQVALGIATLLLVVPLVLAVLHQAGAMLLLSALLWALHRLQPRARLEP